jgi:hypothetical protein
MCFRSMQAETNGVCKARRPYFWVEGEVTSSNFSRSSGKDVNAIAVWGDLDERDNTFWHTFLLSSHINVKNAEVTCIHRIFANASKCMLSYCRE